MPEIGLFEKARFFDDGLPIDVRRVINKRGEFDKGQRFRREFWKISHIIDGRGALILDDKRYPIGPDTVTLIHPKSVTAYDIEGGVMEIYNVLFEPSFIARDIPEINDNFQFFSVFSDTFEQARRARLYVFHATPEVAALIRAMANEYAEKKSNYGFLLKMRLLELLVLLLREGEKNIRHHSPDQIVRYISNVLEHRFRGRIRLDRLAAQTGLSRFRLCRIFKEQTGKTIISALNDIRLDHAADLLRRTDLSVSEISYDAGYNDLAYFYRVFERRFRLRPRQYRQQLQAGQTPPNG